MSGLGGYLNPLNYLQRKRSPSLYRDLPSEHEPLNGTLAYADNIANGDYGDHRQHEKMTGVVHARRARWRCCRIPARLSLPTIIVAFLLFGFLYQPSPPTEDEIHTAELAAHRGETLPVSFFWKVFPRLRGYYTGVYTLVPWSEWQPDPEQRDQLDSTPQPQRGAYPGSVAHLKKRSLFSSRPARDAASPLPLSPQIYSPYPDYASQEYLSSHHDVHPCYMDLDETKSSPDVFVYPGVSQNAPMPFFGSYQELGLRHDVCFERFGRFGPYGYGYSESAGGLGIGTKSERVGTDELWTRQAQFDWTGMDWGAVQDRCLERNQHRFNTSEQARDGGDARETSVKHKVPRTAFLFRTWTGFKYTPHEILTLRSTINELALKSGGEYHVYLLLHVRDETVPIWASKTEAQRVIEKNVPREFWGITVLWSVPQMRMYYPGPYDQTFDNPANSDIHEVYRGNHFPLQWFAHEHPEYDFVWNWEMDIRYLGHHYEFHDRVGTWAKEQPRRGLWERNSKLWIPSYHGNWTNFTQTVDKEMTALGVEPVWGPVTFNVDRPPQVPPTIKPPTDWRKDNFEWGVGEEADLITFNPIFDPAETNWIFKNDISGWNVDLGVPPRRCAIVTVARLSRRLLEAMHNETVLEKHSAFPEMWPPTVALHQGLKAVYIPHPVYFERKWPLEYLDQTFNHPKEASDSPFGWGEHNFLGSTFYFNADFAGELWRRWLGERENDEGGRAAEISGGGRMCLRSSLHHPVKREDDPE